MNLPIADIRLHPPGNRGRRLFFMTHELTDAQLEHYAQHFMGEHRVKVLLFKEPNGCTKQPDTNQGG